MGKDTVVFRYDENPPGKVTPDDMALNLRDYFCRGYGDCEVLHVWRNQGNLIDNDGVPVSTKFAIVLKFTVSPIANQVKQKYHGRLLFDLRVITSWLDYKDIVEMDMSESQYEGIFGTKKYNKWSSGGSSGGGGGGGGASGRGYWGRERERTYRYSSYRGHSPSRSSVASRSHSSYSRGHSPIGDRMLKTSGRSSPSFHSSRGYSPPSARARHSSPTNSPRSHSPIRGHRRSITSGHSSPVSPPRSHSPTRTRRPSNTSSHAPSVVDSPRISPIEEGERPSSHSSQNSDSGSKVRSKKKADTDDKVEKKMDNRDKRGDVPRAKPLPESFSDMYISGASGSMLSEDKGKQSSMMVEKEVMRGEEELESENSPLVHIRKIKTEAVSCSSPVNISNTAMNNESQPLLIDASTIEESGPLVTSFSSTSYMMPCSQRHQSEQLNMPRSDTNHPGSSYSQALDISSACNDTRSHSTLFPFPASSSNEQAYMEQLSVLSEVERQRHIQSITSNQSEFQSLMEGSVDYARCERDETPPADLLEASHHLAQGDYTEWYTKAFQNNPQALQQFLDYYNTMMSSGDGAGGVLSSEGGTGGERDAASLPITGEMGVVLGEGGVDGAGSKDEVALHSFTSKQFSSVSQTMDFSRFQDGSSQNQRQNVVQSHAPSAEEQGLSRAESNQYCEPTEMRGRGAISEREDSQSVVMLNALKSSDISIVELTDIVCKAKSFNKLPPESRHKSIPPDSQLSGPHIRGRDTKSMPPEASGTVKKFGPALPPDYPPVLSQDNFETPRSKNSSPIGTTGHPPVMQGPTLDTPSMVDRPGALTGRGVESELQIPLPHQYDVTLGTTTQNWTNSGHVMETTPYQIPLTNTTGGEGGVCNADEEFLYSGHQSSITTEDMLIPPPSPTSLKALDDGIDTEDELYNNHGKTSTHHLTDTKNQAISNQEASGGDLFHSDPVSSTNLSTTCEMSVQTCEEMLVPPPPSPPPPSLRMPGDVDEKHTHLRTAAMQEFSTKSRTLIVSTLTFIEDNPAMEDILSATLAASLQKLANEVEEKFWQQVDKNESGNS